LTEPKAPPVPVSAEAALAFGRDVRYGHGKIEILPKIAVHGLDEMAVAYTPGVGHAVRLIEAEPERVWEQTAKANLIALVTDATAVMGYGKVPPAAAIPVMEGKATMFKLLAGIDCMPLCLNVADAAQLTATVKALEPSFGAINLEDVAAPQCFDVMRQLEAELSIPAMHDDQYGTATVIAAALMNACRVLGRRTADLTVAVNGIGAAGTATIDLLQGLGVGEVIAVDRAGILVSGEDYPAEHWQRLAETTNRDRRRGGLAEAMAGADAFIGLSVGGLVSPAMVAAMAKDPIVFALANPDPEILPDAAEAAGAAITASGRFDFPNHCNNVLAFPALMRGALDSQAKRVSREMCLAASRAIAGAVPEASLDRQEILPSPLDPDLYPAVAEAVAREAAAQGLARRDLPPGAVAENTRRLRTVAQREP